MEAHVIELKRDQELTGKRPTGESAPTELNEIKRLLEEFIKRYENIENEIELLKEDKKELIEEYKEQLDMPTLKAAMATIRIRSKVARKDTFDEYVEALSKE